MGRDDVARTVAGEERDVVVAEPAHEDGPRRGPNGVEALLGDVVEEVGEPRAAEDADRTSWRLGRRRLLAEDESLLDDDSFDDESDEEDESFFAPESPSDFLSDFDPLPLVARLSVL